MRNERPAGLYVHVPFCSTKCPYCDFYSIVRAGHVTMEEGRFCANVLREAEVRLAGGGPGPGVFERFDTIYLGGGTPSSLAPAAVASLIEGLSAAVTVAGDAEVTIEVNPDDVDPAKARGWREAGVDRVSLGAQSFDDGALGILERRHDAAGSLRAFETLREAGFEKIGLDLIYGIPRMDLREWEAVLDRAVSLRPEHISCYMLTVAGHTPLAARLAGGRLKPAGEGLVREQFVRASRVLSANGYLHYEVSNFSLGAGNLSRHNSKYWEHTPYLGLGPSAHSFDGRRRWWNAPDLDRWSRSLESGGEVSGGSEELSAGQLAVERLYFGLRTSRGIDPATADLFEGGGETVARLAAEGYLRMEGERAVPTLEGYIFSDSLPSMFF